MKNLIDEIKEIISYDDLDVDEKLSAIAKLCNDETDNYEDLLDLKGWVALDICAGNFDIQQTTVMTEGYERVCKLTKRIEYECELDI